MCLMDSNTTRLLQWTLLRYLIKENGQKQQLHEQEGQRKKLEC